MSVCAYCGRANPTEEVFCSGCGTRLREEPEPDIAIASPEFERIFFACFAVLLLYLPYIIGFLFFVRDPINLFSFLALPGYFIAVILSRIYDSDGTFLFGTVAYATSILAVALTFVIGLGLNGRPKATRLLFLAAVFIVSALQAAFTIGGMLM
jgi:hypothetical protein